MDTQLESLPTEKTQPKKVLSSIENRSEMFEECKLTSDELIQLKGQNIRPIAIDPNGTKRYSIPQNYKDSFYAIHHIQRSNESTSPSAENAEPTKSKKLTTMRGRKRVTHEQSLSSTKPSDQQRKRSRQPNTKIRKSSQELTSTAPPQLYKTCNGIWPEQQSLGDLGYDNIKALSNLLKVRLCQAKFKMMAKLDGDNELFTFLAEEYVTPKHKLPCPIQLSGKKQNKSIASVVVPSLTEEITTSPSIPVQPTQSKQKKRKVPRAPNAPHVKAKRSKKKSAAADIAPVTLSDGTSVYVCEPCHKKYKNRNGLAYHLQRCKNTTKDGEDKSNVEESVINCICAQNTDEHGTMVQCDKCRIWLHSECVGLTEEALDDSFHCFNCKEQIGKDLLQSLIDTQTSDREEQSISSQDQINNHLHELFSQTPKNDDEEDELFSAPMEYQDDCSDAGVPSSTQLHVWDDFSFSSTLEKSNEPWSILDDDYENEIPSSSWTMNDIGIFSQPPSLLFSDITMSSALDDESTPLLSDLATPIPISETTPVPISVATPNSVCEVASVCDSKSGEVTTPGINSHTPVHTADGLWFQFANFDDDYQCET